MSNGNFNWIANFIWGIADDVLRARSAVLLVINCGRHHAAQEKKE